MLIQTFEQWKQNGGYWGWANVTGTVFWQPFGEGSPTINSLMCECGYAFDSEESAMNELIKRGYDELNIEPCRVLWFPFGCKDKNLWNMTRVEKYLSTKPTVKTRMFLPHGHYVLADNFSKESLASIDICFPFWGRVLELIDNFMKNA